MRNYFNKDETANHLLAIIVMTSLDNFKNDNCLSDYEKDCLADAVEALQDFNESVIARLGTGYQKSLANKARDNDVRLIPKQIVTDEERETNYAEFIDSDMLSEILERASQIDCVCCNKGCDYKKCAVYNIAMFLGTEPKNDGYDQNRCPFESNTYDDENDEKDLKIFDEEDE